MKAEARTRSPEKNIINEHVPGHGGGMLSDGGGAFSDGGFGHGAAPGGVLATIPLAVAVDHQVGRDAAGDGRRTLRATG
jgi:hypothetical protein